MRRVLDWRDAEPSLVAACYEREASYWRNTLDWDTATTWPVIEEARRAGGLAGFIVADGSNVRGWTFLHRSGDAIFIGALVADDERATGQLVDAIDCCASKRRATITVGLIPDRAAAAERALSAAGFETEPYLYLSRPLTRSVRLQPDLRELSLRPWSPSDFVEAVALLRSSYDRTAALAFSPTGSGEEWVTYLEGLLDRDGCGVFDPVASRVARDERGLCGLVLTSQISTDTLHIAQLAVRPDARRRGIAAGLLHDALAHAAAAGLRQATLLVGQRNDRARLLYERVGFRGGCAFLAARRREKPGKIFLRNGQVA
ncbi:MAG: GNAT family N-acetyltransferase [Vicinamibacterales bacterium]